MRVTSTSFSDGAAIPAKCAFGKHNPDTHVELSDNKNPHLAWSGVPEGTKSFAVVGHDSDVPTKPDDVNQVGRTVPADLARADFFHWVLVDLPATKTEIPEGGMPTGPVELGR